MFGPGEKNVGHTRWAITGAKIPLRSEGLEPEQTSHEAVSFLNTSPAAIEVEIFVYYTERGPIGPYKLSVPPQRVKSFRINDLIDPEAVILDEEYGMLIQANAPVVVQLSRLNSDPSRTSTTILNAVAV